ncbi:unnamed protein product [Litomosoides sigmodontis]|uniref:Uncharacterized protein n=1 Tax=Litomosoides sigmodontis TaxID=42156 RepID=A0A3P7K6P5_LITSI|nr:unnamed protein product [Litomosoides sigmodontis]
MSRKSSPSKNLPHSGSPSEQPSLIRTGSSEEENAAEGLQPRMLRRRAPTTALAFRSIPLILTRDEPESSSPLVGAGPPPPPPLSNIIRPQVTRMRTILVTSSNSAFSPQLLSTSQIFSPSPSIRPASRTSQTFGGVTPANIILSSGSAIDQDDGDELVPLPQVSFLPFGYFPRGPRPVAAGEHPLYRYINMVVDLSRPDNG